MIPAVPPHYTTPAEYQVLAWTAAYAGTPLTSLAGWTEPLNVTFTTPGCPEIGPQLYHGYNGPDGSDTTHKLFGSVPGATCGPGGLSFTQSFANGAWNAFGFSTASWNFSGLTLAVGYYEVTSVLPVPPAGYQPWFAVWGLDRPIAAPQPNSSAEDDYETGMRADGLGCFTDHLWPATIPLPGQITTPMHSQLCVPVSSTDGQRHTDGILYTASWIIRYHDRKEVVRRPRFGAEAEQPQALLVNLNPPYGSNPAYASPTAAPNPPTTVSYTVNIQGVAAYVPPAGDCTRTGDC